MIPLHVKGDFSYGEAVGSPIEFAASAASLGIPALALADSTTLAGQVPFHAACRAHGVHPITGIELALGRSSRCVMLARTAHGYAGLCRVVTALRASPARAGHVALVARHARDNLMLCDDARALAVLEEAGVEPGDLGLLVDTDGPVDSQTVEQARRRDWLVVPDAEIAMPREADRPLFDVKRRIFSRRARLEPSQKRVRSLEAVSWKSQDAMRVTEPIAERCRFDLLSLRDPVALSENAGAALRELGAWCEARVATRPRYVDRIRRELAVIGRMNLASYFSNARAIGDEARRLRIMLATRGSAVSSLVVHLLGLSPVDPVALGLYFERFLRPSRKEPPDIDLDVSSVRRDELIAALTDHFGPDKVALVAAHQTFQRRSAYREGLAAHGLAARDVARFCRNLMDDELDLPLPLHLLPPELRAEASTIERLVDRPSHLSTHPSALLVTDAPMDGVFSLVMAPKRALVTEFDAASLARLRFPKFDLLGSHALAELDEVSEIVGAPPVQVPFDDAATLASIDDARTIGCNQLETPAIQSLLCRLPIRRFDDIVAALALVRPAAGASEAKRAFVARARGRPDGHVDPVLWNILPRTHGIVLYEEDVIRVICALTGLGAEAADVMREELVRGNDVGARFIEAAEGRGTDGREARRVWGELARFAAYSFSQAHATSAALIAFRSAHAKTHHAAAFGCALLNHHGGSYPLRAIAADLVRSGATVLPPSVNASQGPCTVDEGAVRVGLHKVKHLTLATKARLLESRHYGGFKNLTDLERRVPLGRKEREALILSGACDGLPPLSREAYPFEHYAFLGVPTRARPVASEDRAGGHWGVYQKLVRIQNELELLGMHLVAHPLAVLRHEARRAGCLTSAELASRLGRTARFAGLVSAIHRVRRGPTVTTLLTFEDEHGLVEAALSRPADDFSPSVETPGPYLIDGRVRGEPGCIRLEIDAIVPFHRREAPYEA